MDWNQIIKAGVLQNLLQSNANSVFAMTQVFKQILNNKIIINSLECIKMNDH